MRAVVYEAANAFTVFLFEGAPPPPPPGKAPNLLRWILDPKALRSRISNWGEVARYLVSTTYAEILADGGEPKALAFIEEIMAYPGLPTEWRLPRKESPPVMTMQLAKGDFRLAFFSTFTTLAMPTDAALQKLKIECFYPADDATARIARELSL